MVTIFIFPVVDSVGLCFIAVLQKETLGSSPGTVAPLLDIFIWKGNDSKWLFPANS